jgi:hypothetical protein
MSAPVFIVLLRRPGKYDPRIDPFWEFGSFGCTGCHRTNLLHPKNCQIADGARLAFVQGGDLGFRLLMVTAPIQRINHQRGAAARVELRWDASAKPFRYAKAPSLFEAPGPGRSALFPKLAKSVSLVNRLTWDAKFASRFRARSSPLEPELADELLRGFNQAVRKASARDFISEYWQALPWCDVPSTPPERQSRYRDFIAMFDESPASSCRPAKKRQSCK